MRHDGNGLVSLGALCVQDRTPATPTDRSPVLGLDQIASVTGQIAREQGSKAAAGEGTYFAFSDSHVLYCKLRPYLNKVALPDSAGRCSTELVPLKPLEGVDRRYLAYLLRSRPTLDAAIASASGARMPRTNMDVLLRHQVRRHSQEEQRQIVEILDSASSVQRLHKAADDKVQELIPGLFVDMFGDPASNPKGWALGKVADALLASEYGSSSKASDDRVGVPMLRMGNVSTQGELLLDDLKYVSMADDELRKYRLEAGDILFNRTNSKELVGKTGLWDGRMEAVYASYFIRLKVDHRLMLPEVLWAFMNTRTVKGRLFGMAKGAIGQANINAKEVRSMDLYLPPLALQERFSAILKEIGNRATTQRIASRNADAIFGSLSSKLFG